LERPLFKPVSDSNVPIGEHETIGDFHILKLLGSGGMGRVYEAYETPMRRKVALKILNASLSSSQDGVSRFEREAWIGGRLNHPNIVRAYSQGEASRIHYISMELVDGPSLANEILATRAEFAAGVDAKTANDRIRKMVLLFAEVADALHYVHENGIVHRDIKPQNLLFSSGKSRLLLSDFGLARDEAMSQLTQRGDFLGTVRYMSPEQLLAHRIKLDRRTDIWSLGVSLYEAVTLDLPYTAVTEEGYISAVSMQEPLPARARNHAVPRDLETVLIKCLERDPADRYSSAAELRDDLRRLVADTPVLARRPRVVTKMYRFAKRNRNAFGAALDSRAIHQKEDRSGHTRFEVEGSLRPNAGRSEQRS
jgi:serine/threonine protein kinase